MRIDLQPAYILHHRPFRETSLLIDLFTQDHGRIPVVARGVRTARSRWRPVLQPFSRILASCRGRSELMTLSGAESSGAPNFLKGDVMAGGFYFNELLVRFLEREDPHPRLFHAYETALLALSDLGMQERTLRLFEKDLLTELGYGLSLFQTVTHESLLPDAWYRFYPDQGLIRCFDPASGGNVFPGRSLLSLAAGTLQETDALQDAKKLMRLALAALPGARPLQSRRLLLRKVKNQ